MRDSSSAKLPRRFQLRQVAISEPAEIGVRQETRAKFQRDFLEGGRSSGCVRGSFYTTSFAQSRICRIGSIAAAGCRERRGSRKKEITDECRSQWLWRVAVAVEVGVAVAAVGDDWKSGTAASYKVFASVPNWLCFAKFRSSLSLLLLRNYNHFSSLRPVVSILAQRAQ